VERDPAARPWVKETPWGVEGERDRAARDADVARRDRNVPATSSAGTITIAAASGL
jgi:hypothetical protein